MAALAPVPRGSGGVIDLGRTRNPLLNRYLPMRLRAELRFASAQRSCSEGWQWTKPAKAKG